MGKQASSKAIIASSIVSDDEILPAMTNDGEEIPELLNWIEESDARLVLNTWSGQFVRSSIT